MEVLIVVDLSPLYQGQGILVLCWNILQNFLPTPLNSNATLGTSYLRNAITRNLSTAVSTSYQLFGNVEDLSKAWKIRRREKLARRTRSDKGGHMSAAHFATRRIAEASFKSPSITVPEDIMAWRGLIADDTVSFCSRQKSVFRKARRSLLCSLLSLGFR